MPRLSNAGGLAPRAARSVPGPKAPRWAGPDHSRRTMRCWRQTPTRRCGRWLCVSTWSLIIPLARSQSIVPRVRRLRLVVMAPDVHLLSRLVPGVWFVGRQPLPCALAFFAPPKPSSPLPWPSASATGIALPPIVVGQITAQEKTSVVPCVFPWHDIWHDMSSSGGDERRVESPVSAR